MLSMLDYSHEKRKEKRDLDNQVCTEKNIPTNMESLTKEQFGFLKEFYMKMSIRYYKYFGPVSVPLGRGGNKWVIALCTEPWALPSIMLMICEDRKTCKKNHHIYFLSFFLFLYVLGHLNTNLHEDTQNTGINI